MLVLCSHDPFKGVGGDKTATRSILNSAIGVFDITILCFSDENSSYIQNGVEVISIKYPPKYKRIFLSVFKLWTMGACFGYFWNPAFRSKILEICEEKTFHCVVSHHAYMAPYNILFPKRNRFCEIHVLDSRVYFESFKRNWHRIHHLVFAFDFYLSERKYLKLQEKCFFLSSDELSSFPNVGVLAELPISTAPNAVSDLPKQNKLFFVGDFNWMPNILTVHNIIEDVKSLRRTDPSLSIDLIGANLADELCELVRRQNGLRYLGYQENLKYYFQNYLGFYAPMAIGGGVRLKILEAIQHGIPCVTNTIGLEGLPAGHPCFVANNENELSAVICRLQNMSILDREKLREDSFEYITEHFGDDKRVKYLLEN